MKFEHIPILRDQCIQGLNIQENGIYVDGTAGGGGHSHEIAKRLTGGKLICIDQDQEALDACKKRLQDVSDRVIFVKGNFQDIDLFLEKLHIDKIDGCLLDIGVSSYQIDNEQRGFSYMKDAPLDMRMDKQQNFSAYDVINDYSEEELTRILWSYGEEKWAKRISQVIGEKRSVHPIETTFELIEIIERAIPKKARMQIRGHVAKKTFQAIRIEVNRELDVLNRVIPKVVDRLNVGGRFAIITFHSLEDRIVKHKFKELATGCICPPEILICVCHHKEEIKLITRKPIEPSDKEKQENSRARSAKLRICEKR